MIEKDGVVAKQEDLVDDNSIKVNNISENVKDGCEGAVQAPSVPQTQSQQSQGATVCWERFLHIRSLKVLLVEYDDSTRHVVAALLRNCSYEVIEAANGLQAWKILEDLANHVDLVLTEVVMPGLSGVGLLCKIMSHKTRKTVPVIMMSSLDSMGLVFKCLSKGAVDFLVKPIRKNELKNFWQHVWRRCHSSSGSGSESGTQTQKSVRSKSVDKADNNAGSSDEDDNGSIGVNAGDGSSTQSSWTKQAVEVDSPRISTPDRVAECPDSTCAQVIHSNAEISGNKGVPVTVAKEFQEHVEQLDSIAIVREGEHRSLDLQQYPKEVPLKLISTKQNHSEFDEPIDEKKWDLNIESPSRKQNPKLTDPSGVTTKTTESGKDNTTNETSTRISKILDINAKATEDVKKLPSVELSLKRSRGVEDTDVTIQDDRNVLRRSNSSAFLRYNTASNLNKGSSGNIENASQVDNNLETTRKGSILDVRSHAYSNLYNRSSNARSNNMDMGNTTDNCLIKPVVLKKSEVPCTVNCFHPSSAFQAQPMKSECRNNHQVVLEKGDDAAATTSRGKQQKQLQFQHLMRHYDNCHHLLCSNQQSQLPDDQDNISLKRMAAAVPQSGSSNVLGGLVEGNAANYSVNGSASGSNHGSNGPNGSSTAVNGKGMNMESDNGASGRSGSSNASESGSGRGNRVDQNKFAHQEASLTKFRQKRKERCFRKKVRYQSRKKLAEQRQCVQGPFVRQNVNENSSREGES